MKRMIGGLIVALGAPSLLVAQEPEDIPTYDIESYCEEVSQAVGGSYQIRNACIAEEKKARAVARRFGWVEKRIRDYCAEVGEAVGGSYQIYTTCVEQELKARGRTP